VLAAFIAAIRTPQRKVRNMRKLFIIGLLAAPLSLGTAYAQATTSTPGAKAATKPRSSASVECSKRADAQNLHGKERKKFRADCKKELAKKG
jgi:psiF repeat